MLRFVVLLSIATAQMTVRYDYENGQQGTAIAYGSGWPNNTPAAAQSNWLCYDWQGKDSQFQNLETFQIVLDSNDKRDVVNIYPEMAGTSYIVYHENGEWQKEMPFGKPFQAKGLSSSSSKMFTLFAVDSQGHRDPKNAYAVWVSKRVDSATPVADREVTLWLKDFSWKNIATSGGSIDELNKAFYNGNAFTVAEGANQPVPGQNTESSLARPQWSYSNGQLGYYGSLFRFSKLGSKVISIGVDDHADIELPLTSDYGQWDLNQFIGNLNDKPGNLTIEEFIQQQLTNGVNGQTTAQNLMNTAEGKQYLWTKVSPKNGYNWQWMIDNGIKNVELKNKVEVFGYGKLVGKWLRDGMINNQWGWNIEASQKSLLSHSNPIPLGELLEYIEFKILSNILSINSSYQGGDKDYSIDVWGIGIADTAKANQSGVQLNGYNRGNSPNKVKMYDVKFFGAWIDATDAPASLAENSYFSNNFFHSADDNIKVGATGVQFIKTVVFQGNSGGVVNMGMYGTITENIQWAKVSDVYVHRITQKQDQFDGRGGMLVIRAGEGSPNIQNITVSGVYVPALGGNKTGKGLKGPNVIYRAWAFGLLPFSIWGASRVNKYTLISGITLLDSHIYTNPLAESLIYAGSRVKFDAAAYTKFFGNAKCGKISNLSFYDVKATTAEKVEETMFRIYYSDTEYYGVWPNGLQNAKENGHVCNPSGWLAKDGQAKPTDPLTAPNADWPQNKIMIPGTPPGQDNELADYGTYPAVGGDFSNNAINTPYWCQTHHNLLV
jgi:hypothetical protein